MSKYNIQKKQKPVDGNPPSDWIPGEPQPFDGTEKEMKAHVQQLKESNDSWDYRGVLA